MLLDIDNPKEDLTLSPHWLDHPPPPPHSDISEYGSS